MSKLWPKVPIKTVYLGLYDGPHATPPMSEDGPVFLGIGNVTEDGHIDLEGVRHISEVDFPKWTKRVTPQPGDIVFTYEATLNRYAIVPEGFRGCLGRRMALIRPDPDKVDTRFLLYTFFGQEWRATIEENRLAGATVDRIPLTRFPEFPIRLPSLPTQRKIAAVLSAYDDLIENNARRVRVLEDMARALYREWFVEYRFPGHEKAEFVEDEQGRRPKEWERSTIGQAFITILGGTPSRARPEFWSGEIPWLNSGKANELRVIEPSELITEEGLRRSAAKMMPAGATIIAITGATLGQVSRLEIRASGNQSLVGLWGFEDYQNTFIYLSTKLKWIDSIVSKAGGGAQQHVNKDKINETDIILPDQHTLERFDADVKPIFDLLRALLFKNYNLRRTRDLLLPRLVSGELDVSELEISSAEGAKDVPEEAVA